MARKNIQDDGSYQKSQKLGNSKGKFDKKKKNGNRLSGHKYFMTTSLMRILPMKLDINRLMQMANLYLVWFRFVERLKICFQKQIEKRIN